MNLDSINGQDLTGAFKITNLTVSGLCVCFTIQHGRSCLLGLDLLTFQLF